VIVCEVCSGCVWGSVLAITRTRAVISCGVSCCWRPFFKKNLVLTSQLTAVVLRLPQTPAPANSICYNIDIGDLPTPIRRCSTRLRCRRFSMSDVYIGRTLVVNGLLDIVYLRIYMNILYFYIGLPAYQEEYNIT